MSDVQNLCVENVSKDTENNTSGFTFKSSQGSRARTGRKRLSPCKRRYSKRYVYRERRRRLALKKALQNDSLKTPEEPVAKPVDEPSTSDGCKCVKKKLICRLSDEETETASSDDLFEETEDERREIPQAQTTTGTDFENVISEEEGLVIEKSAVINEPQKESYSSSGLSIVDIQHVIAEMQRIGDHAIKREDCGVRHLKITGIKRSGLRTKVNVMCTVCHYKGEICSQANNPDEMDINQSAVAGTFFTGGSYAQMEEFLSSMNIPCMYRNQFRKNHDQIVDALLVAAEEEMLIAAEEEKLLAIERGDVSESGIPHIPVVTDGSWMKRSYRTGPYNSISGVGMIIGYYTKKVLFMGVRNKVCKICRCAAAKKQAPRSHTCYKNWENRASTTMECDAVLEGFKTSVEKRGLIYSTLISDGDSSVYKKILDADPYNGQIRVKKIECSNHLLRNFAKKMKEVVKKTPPGTLRHAVEKSIRRMRANIIKAADYRYNQNLPLVEKLKNLYGDMQNVASHSLGEHAECARINNFCNGTNKENEKNVVPELTRLGIYQQIKEILRPVIAHTESLLYNSTNNIVESLNAIIAKYTGGKRLHLGERGSYTGRCAAAVLQHNTKDALSRLNTAMKKIPSKILRNMENKRKLQNQKKAKKKKEMNNTKQVRKQFRATTDSDYGPDALKPGIEEVIYELEQQIFKDTIHNRRKPEDTVENDANSQAKRPRLLNYKSRVLTAADLEKSKSCLYPRFISAPVVTYEQDCDNVARKELSEDANIQECEIIIDASIPFLRISSDGILEEGSIPEIKTPDDAIETVEANQRIFQDTTDKTNQRKRKRKPSLLEKAYSGTGYNVKQTRKKKRTAFSNNEDQTLE